MAEKCVFGTVLDKSNAEACWELAKKCHTEIRTDAKTGDTDITTGKDIVSGNKYMDIIREIRKELLDEYSLEIHEDIADTYEISENEYPRQYIEPILIQGNDSWKEYIKKRMKEKYGSCFISMLGIERQFNEEISEGYFQSKDNARIVKNIDKLIFGIEPIIGREYAYEDRKDIINKIIANNDILSTIYNNLESFRYPVDKAKSIQDLIQILEKLDGKNLNVFMVGLHYIKHIKIINKILKLYGKESVSVYNPSENRHTICNDITNPKINQRTYKICSEATLDNRQHLVIYMIEDDGRMVEVGRLNCFHNFLNLVKYPESIKNKWLDIQLAYESGEINEEQATKLLEDLAKLEDMFQMKVQEGSADEGFESPTTYIPIRLRLYGAQFFNNNLINNTLAENPFTNELVPNSYIYNTIKNAFIPMEIEQLRRHIIYEKGTVEELSKKIENIISKQQIIDYIQNYINIHAKDFIGIDMYYEMSNEDIEYIVFGNNIMDYPNLANIAKSYWDIDSLYYGEFRLESEYGYAYSEVLETNETYVGSDHIEYDLDIEDNYIQEILLSKDFLNLYPKLKNFAYDDLLKHVKSEIVNVNFNIEDTIYLVVSMDDYWGFIVGGINNVIGLSIPHYIDYLSLLRQKEILENQIERGLDKHIYDENEYRKITNKRKDDIGNITINIKRIKEGFDKINNIIKSIFEIFKESWKDNKKNTILFEQTEYYNKIHDFHLINVLEDYYYHSKEFE